MTKNVTITYETAPGTKVDGGYFVPDIWVIVRRPGFIGWLLRFFGSDHGYIEKKMYESLLSEQVSIGRAVRVPAGTVTIETDGVEYELQFSKDFYTLIQKELTQEDE